MVDTGNKTGFPPIRPVEKPADGDAVDTPSVSSTVRAEQTPVSSDTFLRAPTSSNALSDQSSPTQGLWSERRGSPQRLIAHSEVLKGATSIALQPEQDFETALRDHYGESLPDSLIKTIAALNRRSEMPNRRVILAPQLDALYLDLNPSERAAQRSMI